MNRKIFISGAVLGVLAIILGAFAAHGLEKVISKEAIGTFETGVRYQMYHALLLLFVGTTEKLSIKVKKWILFILIIGLILFSGSIYGLSTNTLSGFDFKKIAFITPIGGLFLIGAWLILLIKFLQMKRD